MKKQRLFYAFALLASQALAQSITVTGPDKRLKVDLAVNGGIPMYSVSYDGKTILEKSPLGLLPIREISAKVCHSPDKKPAR